MAYPVKPFDDKYDDQFFAKLDETAPTQETLWYIKRYLYSIGLLNKFLSHSKESESLTEIQILQSQKLETSFMKKI